MKVSTLDALVDQDFKRVSKRIERFISNYVSRSSAMGVVIGLSGGLDSSVVLKLSVNAIGSSRVLGIVMPSDISPRQDTEDAIELARSFGISYRVIDIGSVLKKYAETLPDDNKKAIGNLMARIRMSILYYFSNIGNYIVAGTSDKSEIQIGYSTKFGDGAADILPIADLYKTQVRVLAKYLKIPRAIVEKRSSPRLWDAHMAEEEIGMTYETIDPILYLLLDKKLKPRLVAKKLGIHPNNAYKVKNMIDSSVHKRNMPAISKDTKS